MNSDDLALFAHVARTRSISRAAIDLAADQSTISRRIGLLEAELGGRLFHRSGRGVNLTERGKQLLGYAESMMRTLEEAKRAMRDSSEHGPARLRIAAQPTIAQILFGGLGHALKGRFPLTQVRFIEGLASNILERLSDGEIDVAIMYLPESFGGMQFDLLLCEDVHLITPAKYALPGNSIDVRDLGEIPLILPSTHHGLRVLVESLAARYGFSVNIALECDGSISITKRLVLENCGCTILPSAAVIEEVLAGRLKSYRLENPAITRDVAIVWPKKCLLPDDIWKVAQIIRQCSEKLLASGAWPDARLQSARKTEFIPQA